jgi:lipopolysaccharide transport system permease protein
MHLDTGSDQRAPTLPLREMVPVTGLQAMKAGASSLISGFGPARALAWRFFLRDTRADHRQSLLGYLWLIVPPLANALVWIFLNDQNVISVDSRGVPYPVFVLAGTVLWTAFNASVMGMLGVISGARSFLGKVNFPHESLVYSSILKTLVDASIAAVILVPAILVFGVPVTPVMGLFLFALASCLILGWAVGLLLLPIAALYSDVSRAMQLVLRFGFFLTPIIFPLPASGFARALMLWNPVTPLITTGRSWLTGSAEAMPGPFLVVLIVSIAVLSASLVVYKVTLPHLVERLST